MPAHCPSQTCRIASIDLDLPVATACPACGTMLVAPGAAASSAPYEDLPTVLALPLAEMSDEPTPALALWAACDAAEIALKLCVMVGVTQHDDMPRALANALKDKVALPTLGRWLAMARDAARHERPGAALSIRSAVRALEDLLGPADATVETGLLALRNRLAHAGPVSKGEATRLLATWGPKVRAWSTEGLGIFRESSLAAVDADGRRILLRGKEGLPSDTFSAIPADAPTGSAWLCAAERALPLGPLATFHDGVQLYVRCGPVRLQYLRLGDDGGLRDSDPAAHAEFRRRFLPVLEEDPSGRSNGHVIRDFLPEIRRESERRVGREPEFEALRVAVQRLDGGLLWVDGSPGIGKSNLMAALMEELLDRTAPDTLVLPYRFRASDERCSRSHFLTYVRERLDNPHWIASKDDREQAPAQDAITEVRALLDRRIPGKRVLLVVDGLDEVVQRDARFVHDALLRLRQPGVTIVAAGRQEGGLRQVFVDAGATVPFPDGLPSMSDNDVRALLLERTGGVRKRLLARDREAGGAIHNAFVEQVTQRSHGLPIYVNYVVGDLNAGRIQPEAPALLPDGLHAYHDDLLRRASVGDLQHVTPSVLALLARAYEPLSIAEITALLVRRQTLTRPDADLVERAIASLTPMLRRGPKGQGPDGYELFHHSLRTHVQGGKDLEHTVGTMRNALADAARRPAGDAAEGYLHRCGVRHLLDADRATEALGLLTDLEGVMARFRFLEGSGRVIEDWYADWERLAPWTAQIQGDARIWVDFARTRRHQLLLAGWQAHHALFQCAMDHAEDSPITRAAEAIAQAGRVDWPWMRRLKRQDTWRESPVLRKWTTLVAERATAVGAPGAVDAPVRTEPTGRPPKASTQSQYVTLRVDWERSTIATGKENGEVALLHWPSDRCHALPAPDTAGGCRALAISAEGATLAVTHTHGHACAYDTATRGLRWQQVRKGVRTEALAFLPDGRVLAGDTSGTLHLWDGSTGEVATAVPSAHAAGIRALCVSADGSVGASAATDGSVRLWRLPSLEALATLRDASNPAAQAIALSPNGARCVVGSADGALTVWETPSYVPRVLDACAHRGAVTGVCVSADGRRILSAGQDTLVRLWDADSGRRLADLVGHAFQVVAVDMSPDGRTAVSASTDDAVILWDLERAHRAEDTSALGLEVISLAELRSGPDAGTLAAGYIDGTVRLLSATRLEPLPGRRWVAHAGKRVMQIAHLPGTNRLVSAALGGSVCVSDATTGQVIELLEGRPPDAATSDVPKYAVAAVSPDGRTLVTSAGDSRTLTLRSLVPGTDLQPRPLATSRAGVPHEKPIRAVVFEPDGVHLRAADEDGKVRRWSLLSGQEDVAACIDHYAAWRARRQEGNRQKARLSALALSPDGRTLACGGSSLSITLWDTVSARCIGELEGHAKAVTFLAFLRGGRVLASSGWDDTLRLWDAATGRLLAMQPVERVSRVLLLPDRDQVVIGTTLGQVWASEFRNLDLPDVDEASPLSAR